MKEVCWKNESENEKNKNKEQEGEVTTVQMKS